MIFGEYNRDPWDVKAEKATLADIYGFWLEKRAPKLQDSNRSNLKTAYKYISQLNNKIYKKIMKDDMQDCIDSCGKGYSTQAIIKNLWGHLDKYAYEADVITKRRSETLTSAPIPESSKTPFTDAEVNKLWGIKNEPWVDTILILMYTGFRISELLDLRTENVDWAEGTLKGGTKTKAGKDRLVPIHPKIEEFIRTYYDKSNEYLFDINGKKLTKGKYYEFWKDIMKKLNMKHTPHECRHTFRSRLDSAGANNKCMDLLMGHKSEGTGAKIYCHKTLEELKATILLIK